MYPMSSPMGHNDIRLYCTVSFFGRLWEMQLCYRVMLSIIKTTQPNLSAFHLLNQARD